MRGLWLGVLLGGTLGLAQSSTLSVTTRLVVLDVAVTDAEGRPVTDLTVKDFRVFEDRTEQRIRDFQSPAAHMLTAVEVGKPVVLSSADLRKIGEAPITILLLDEINMPFSEEVYARDQVAKWLQAQPAVLAQPTMLAAVTYKDLEVLVDTTQDRDQIAKTLRKHYATVPWRSYNSGTIGGTASDLLAADLGALEQIAQAMRGVPGRKNVIWVGDGFPAVQPTDVTVTAADQVKAQLRRLSGLLLQSRIALSVLGPTVKAPNRPTDIETGSDSIGGALTANGTGSSGTISVGGLGQSSTVPLGGDLSFPDLAAPTGGKAYRGRNNMDKELAEVLSTGTVYYTMSYTPTSSSEAEQRYRKIRVDVLRPGLRLQSRDGYYPQDGHDAAAPASAPSKQQLAFDLLGAAHSRLAYSGLHLSPVRTDATHWTLQVDAPDVSWQRKNNGRLEAKSIVLAAYFDAHEKMLGRSFDSIGLETEATGAQILGRQALLRVTTAAPAGTVRLRFVVRDMNSGRVGTADAAP